MIATHKIKKSGRWYYAGEEIDSSPVDFMNPPEETNEKSDVQTYTKTDINRMSVDNLRSLATEQGIEDADEMNGSDIKKLLIERMGL